MYHTEHQCFYNTRHKSLKQKPFPMNFLLNFLHSLFTHLFSLKSAHLLPQCWATCILEYWDDCNTQINIGEGETHTSVPRFVTSIVATDDLLITSSQTEIDVRGEGWRWLAFSTTSSVLSLFILSLFAFIQASISRTQSFTANFASSAEDDSEVRGVSSAYKWKATWLVSHNITQGWSIKQE